MVIEQSDHSEIKLDLGKAAHADGDRTRLVLRKPWRSRSILPFSTDPGRSGHSCLLTSLIEGRLKVPGCGHVSGSDARAVLLAATKSFCTAVLTAVEITSSRGPNPFGLLAISGLTCYPDTMSCMPIGQTRSDVS